MTRVGFVRVFSLLALLLPACVAEVEDEPTVESVSEAVTLESQLRPLQGTWRFKRSRSKAQVAVPDIRISTAREPPDADGQRGLVLSVMRYDEPTIRFCEPFVNVNGGPALRSADYGSYTYRTMREARYVYRRLTQDRAETAYYYYYFPVHSTWTSQEVWIENGTLRYRRTVDDDVAEDFEFERLVLP